MATWNFDSPTQDVGIQNVQHYLTENLQSTKAGVNGARMLDLYKFLHSTKFSSPQELRAAVVQEGEPMFSDAEALQIFNQLKMKGGGQSAEFFDAMARKLAGYTGDWIPQSLKGYLYFLKGLEQNPDQGPLVSTTLDVVAQGLPTIASTIQTLAPQLIGALPIPSAAIAGVIIGWVMSAFLLFLAIITNLSRKKFGAAFVTSIALLPVVGSSIMNAAKSFERITGKMSDRRERLVKSVNGMFGPAVGSTVTGFIPDLNEPPGPEEPVPSVSIPSLSSLGIPTSLEGAKALLPAGIPTSLEGAKAMALSKVPTGIPTSLEGAKALATSKLPSVPSLETAKGLLPASMPSLSKAAAFASSNRKLGIPNMLTRKPAI